ncbi:MAG: aminotransferase class III-fold pyridoxal phosphate-dependent enzyme, partial [Candidatus Eremiobacteraeota bacterium]|nr:aminotransferase class III-fold pyridoxal phosphate-dependent enzyme [Candidatus Eremiobacteraeota bacterium]
EHSGIVPDLLCIGKGMSSGFPISACVGTAKVMDRWPESRGEAIHTSTSLGNPAGCAAALASIAEIERLGLVERAADLEAPLSSMLQELRDAAGGRIGQVRGRGLMWGIECVDMTGAPSPSIAAAVVSGALRRGVIVLAAGPSCNVVSLSPSLTITLEQLRFGADVLRDAISELS